MFEFVGLGTGSAKIGLGLAGSQKPEGLGRASLKGARPEGAARYVMCAQHGRGQEVQVLRGTWSQGPRVSRKVK